MICPNCESNTETQETIKQRQAVYRQHKCKFCGFKFFTKESVVSSDEAQPLFTEWTRERSRKHRAKKKGEEYNVSFEDGRENRPEPRLPISPLF